MRVTLWLDARRPWSELLALARDAEGGGWDGVRVGDAPDGRECWTVLGGLASSVPRVRLEGVVRDEVGRHPAVVAKLASTVDQLSGGRLLLGWSPAPGEEDRLVEGVEVVKSLASRERTTLRGRLFRLQDAPLDPKPVQQPFPVMIVGGTPELAARCADHWSIGGTAQDVASQLGALGEACRAQGRDPSEIRVSAWAEPEVSQSAYAAAGVDEWVVPDAALGPDRAAWRESLARIGDQARAVTRSER